MSNNTTDYGLVPLTHAFPITDSSFVEFLGYDREEDVAYVQLDHGTYVYSDVSLSDFLDLANADSVGHQFHDFSRKYGPYSEFYSQGELFYSMRDSVEEASESTEEDDVADVLTLVPGTNEETDDGMFSSMFDDLLPSDEEVAEAKALRLREFALAAAAASVSGAKNPVKIYDVITRAEEFEAYLAGE